MDLTEILTEVDNRIAMLKQARALLSGDTVVKCELGRPKPTTATAKPIKKKRNLTPEGRKRIAEAVKRRWAAQKKAAK